MLPWSFSFALDDLYLEENRRETPKPELVVQMLADSIREVSYSVKKHKGGPNSGFEMDCPMGNEDCMYRWQVSNGFNNPIKGKMPCMTHTGKAGPTPDKT
jgi:hypothetical protein